MKGPTRSLKLSLERQFGYYYVAILLSAFAIVPLYFLLASKPSKFLTPTMEILIASFFALLSLWSFLRQKRALRFYRIDSQLDTNIKNKIVREILREHHWTYSVSKRNYLEATGDGFREKIDLRTWSHLLTIVVDREGILINSICDPDGLFPQPYSFGKNKQNITDFEILFFQKTYSLLEMKEKNQL